jgi:hypothetical protein
MTGLHTHSVAPNHRTPITMTFVAGLGVLLMAGTGLPSVALAQNNPALGTDARGTPLPSEDTQPAEPQGRIPQAPVGHRQPRPQDLPPSVLRNEGGEGRGVNADRELDQKLQICKGC